MFVWLRKLKERDDIPDEDKALREEQKRRKKSFSTKSRTTTIKVDGDVIILNGKRLRPGSPEYKKAQKIVNNGMSDIGRQMGELGKELGQMGKQMGDDLRDMFKDFRL